MPKVTVPQKDGSITISVAGDEPRTYHVNEGQVTVAEKDVERFLTAVDGSKVAGATKSGSAS